MKRLSLAASTALALVLPTQSALAVTAEEVWANWKSAAADAGQQVSVGAEARNGSALEITDLKSTVVIPDSDLILTTTIPRVTLTDKGDGSVAITLSESYPMTLTEFGTTPSKAGVEITLSLPGASVVASGTAAAVSYVFAIPTITARLTKATDPDGTPVDATMDVTAAGMAGTYLVSPQAGGGNALDAAVSLEKIDIAVAATNPDADERFKASLSAAGIAGKSKGMILPADAMADIAAALAAGFAIDSLTQTGPVSVSVEFAESSVVNTWTGAVTGLTAAFLIDKARLDYGFGLTGGQFAASMPSEGMPPVDGTFGEIAFRLAGPLAKSDVAADFGVLLRLVEVAASESVWALAGPASALPHDPVTAILDVKGKMAWKVDIMDPKVQSGEVPMPEMPVLLDSAELTQLLLKFVGAEATATGALTFDNADLATWEGIPAPTGTITANMKGVNTLIDKLVQVGLLPEDEVMSMRMMLAMFAKPGAGPDELVSEVVFRDKGLFVNGQQLR